MRATKFSKPYRVVRIDNGPDNPHTGFVSQHASLAAAQAAIARSNRQLRKQPGYASAWHPYAIEELTEYALAGGVTGYEYVRRKS